MALLRRPRGFGDATLRSLIHYKRSPHRIPAGRTVRIWSDEHCAYWRPGGAGYTGDRAQAGTWPVQDAVAMTRHCDADKRIWFVFVRPGDTGEAARRECDWHEDIGDVLWWKFPINEPPWVGSPLDSNWPGYHTHWTPLPPIPHKPKPRRKP